MLGLLDGVFGGCSTARRPCCPSGSHSFIELLRRIPGLGVLVMLVGLLLTGVFATNIVGQWALRQGHRAAQQDPDRQVDLQLGAAGLGHAVLEQRQCLSRGGAGASTRAPAPGRSPSSPAGPAARRRSHLRGDYLSIYVPTTPNPTSGFFLMVPRADVIALAMSVDEALKYVISMGVVAPPSRLVGEPPPLPLRNPIG